MPLKNGDFHDIFKSDFADDLSKKAHPSTFFTDGNSLNESEITLNFSDEFSTEQSVSIFLTTVGFSTVDSGTKYLIFILSACINNMDTSLHMAKYFNFCSKAYNIMPNNIRIAIEKAIDRAGRKSGDNRLSKINEILKAEYITDEKVSASMFISFVAQRFMILKKYGKTLSYIQGRPNPQTT